MEKCLNIHRYNFYVIFTLVHDIKMKINKEYYLIYIHLEKSFNLIQNPLWTLLFIRLPFMKNSKESELN